MVWPGMMEAPVIKAAVKMFWDLTVQESQKLGGGNGKGVTREGYIQMHIRTSKVLSASFDIATATDMANGDWCAPPLCDAADQPSS